MKRAIKYIHNLFLLIRPLSNIKNIAIIILALFISRQEFSIFIFMQIFLSLSFVSGFMYTFNSLNDINLDNKNINKKSYSQSIQYFGKIRTVKILILFLILGLFIGLTLNIWVFIFLLCFALTAYFYSSQRFRFKEKYILDVLFGAVFTFGFRFLAAWFALASFPIPLLALGALICAKSSGYILYKTLDRNALEQARIHNTITSHCPSFNFFLSFLFLLLSMSFVIAMCLLQQSHPNWLGNLPFSYLFAIPFSLPPILIISLQIFRPTTFRNRTLRTIGFFYLLLVTLLIWKFF